jgi:hypothetical protein
VTPQAARSRGGSAQEFALVDRLSRTEGPGALMRRLALEKVAADGIATAPRRLQGGHIVKAS